MENPILMFFCAVIVFSVCLHIVSKCSRCLHSGETVIEDDTVKNK